MHLFAAVFTELLRYECIVGHFFVVRGTMFYKKTIELINEGCSKTFPTKQHNFLIRTSAYRRTGWKALD